MQTNTAEAYIDMSLEKIHNCNRSDKALQTRPCNKECTIIMDKTYQIWYIKDVLKQILKNKQVRKGFLFCIQNATYPSGTKSSDVHT